MRALSTLLFALVALGSRSAFAQDAWPLVEKAASIARDSSTSPLLERVRAMSPRGEPLLDEEAGESLGGVREASGAISALDAAVVSKKCAIPSTKASSLEFSSIVGLAEHVLAAALFDALEKKPALVVAQLGRVGDLAKLLAVRCATSSTASSRYAFEASLAILERARAVAWLLAVENLVDASTLAKIASSLEPSPSTLERIAGPLAKSGQSAAVEELGRRLDVAMRDQAALTAAASSPAAFAKIERPARDLAMQCDAVANDPAKFTVSRRLARELRRRGAEIGMSDSRFTPVSSPQNGLRIDDAGPLASSCGIRPGDVVLEVNGIAARLETLSMIANVVTRDENAAIRLLRDGRVLDVNVSVRR